METKHIIIAILLLFASKSHALPSFPNAEGWGTDTVGGRSSSAKICKVNTTNGGSSSGSCSDNICIGNIRYCLTMSGSRHVIFTTGGTINLSSSLTISNPYLTVAGQTAPGGGIQITGAAITISTYDVIIRGLKFRAQINTQLNINGSSTNTSEPTYNVVIDHNSFEFASSKLVSYWYNPKYSTFSRNIVAYPLLPSGMGVLVGGWDSCSSAIGNGGPPANHISIHHNLFSHVRDRNPLIKSETTHTEVINNLVYNWDYYGFWTMAATYAVGNHYIAGAQSDAGVRPIQVVYNSPECPALQADTVYIAHNIGPGRLTDTGEEWNIVVGGPSIYKSTTPPFTLSGISEHEVTSVKSNILADVGARIPSVDDLDQSAINTANNSTGNQITSPSEVGGIPTLAVGTYPTDTDGDGIPDAWEIAHQLNPNNAADARNYAPSGYTWIEEYINSFFPVSGSGGTPITVPSPQTIMEII